MRETLVEVPLHTLLAICDGAKEVIDLRHRLSVTEEALRQAQNAAIHSTQIELSRANILGRIAIALFGMQNNVSDEACAEEAARVARIAAAAQALANEAQEYNFDDIGLGRGAPNSYWEDLDDALEGGRPT